MENMIHWVREIRRSKGHMRAEDERAPRRGTTPRQGYPVKILGDGSGTGDASRVNGGVNPHDTNASRPPEALAFATRNRGRHSAAIILAVGSYYLAKYEHERPVDRHH
jgi:hypothetical protein